LGNSAEELPRTVATIGVEKLALREKVTASGAKPNSHALWLMSSFSSGPAPKSSRTSTGSLLLNPRTPGANLT
jgi:hypothetical protein